MIRKTHPTVRFLVLGLLAVLMGVMAYGTFPAPRLVSMPWIEEHVMVPMRDGVHLQTIVWRPRGSGRYPAVLGRGYGPAGQSFAEPFLRAGYTYVGQATRGHGESEGTRGVADRFHADAADGSDTLTWIAGQGWSDGRIAMYGRSYWAATQWLAAVEQHPNLKAIIPQAMNADLWQCAYYCHGALSLALTAGGRAFDKRASEDLARAGWDRFFRHLPLATLDDRAPGPHEKGATELWRAYVRHSTFDDYWAAVSLRADGRDGKYGKITVPVYLMGGWYDYYAGAALSSYQRLREARHDREVRIVINPSDHLNRIVGDRDFGTDAQKDETALAIRWLDEVLKGEQNGIGKEPPVKVFVMGANRWRAEWEWPLAGTQFTNYYLHAVDGGRIGTLDTVVPGDERGTEYTYDPEDPVPTIGGNHSVTDRNLAGVIRAGAVDQRPNEARGDVLVFTTAPLAGDVEVTGPVHLVLYAASSARDTDFTATLIDVHPDGTAYNLTEGIIRARFRNSIWDPPELLQPGTVYRYRLEMHPTSNVFLAGHAIRIHVTSSNFPLWDRNLNTGHTPGTDTEIGLARQTVFHDRRYPSHIVLPVIPAA